MTIPCQVKPIKMLGLAALAAAMMALAGASTAVAEPTGVCTSEIVVEEELERCPALYHLEAKSKSKAKLLTNLATVECDVSFLGSAASSESAVFNGKSTYSNCGTCEVIEENGPSSFEVLWKSTEEAAVTGKGLLKVLCGKTLSCSFSATGVKGTAKGALSATNKTGEISFLKQKVTVESGTLCPKEASLDLELALPSPIYLKTSSAAEMVCYLESFIAFFLNNPDGKYCTGFDFLPIRTYELAWSFGG